MLLLRRKRPPPTLDANQLFKSGKLAEAIDAQLAVVKAKPMDQGQRLFLFEMLVFSGDLDRAQKQIDAIQTDQPEILTALMDYRKLLDAERARRQVFGNKVQPGFLGPVPEHVRLRLLGLVKLADKATAEAAALFQEANGQIAPVQGSLNGQAFSGLRDGDDCLGSVLEVYAQGRYFWVPLEQVQTLTMNAPRFPRDLLWIPAHLEMKEGEAGSVFLPALYPGTDQESDPQLKLGRMTDWRGEDPVRGVGVKIFFVGTDESSILDWRKLELSA
jgi:type VI secretion system protein ImpE